MHESRTPSRRWGCCPSGTSSAGAGSRPMSALGIEAPGSPRARVRAWANLNTDAMIVGESERASWLPTSTPVGAGEPNRFDEFISEFCAGFADELALVANQKSRWLGVTGYLARFKDMKRRVVVRPTWIYLWLRQQQLEPGSLRSPRHHRLTLEMLSRSYLLRPTKPHDWLSFSRRWRRWRTWMSRSSRWLSTVLI